MSCPPIDEKLIVDMTFPDGTLLDQEMLFLSTPAMRRKLNTVLFLCSHIPDYTHESSH